MAKQGHAAPQATEPELNMQARRLRRRQALEIASVIRSLGNLAVTWIRHHKADPAGRVALHRVNHRPHRVLPTPQPCSHSVDPKRAIDQSSWCDPYRPAPWPYNSAMPVGLEELPDLPYDRPDNAKLPTRRPQLSVDLLQMSDQMVANIFDETV